MARQFTIIIFVVLVGLFACKRKQDNFSSASINMIVREIAKTNVLMGDAVGIAGERPKQWDRYEVLRSKATDKELLTLTYDTNAVVRCYAFQALASRSTTVLFPSVVQHLSDTTTVYTLYGCLGGSQKVGDFFIETITERADEDEFHRLNKKQKATIDSLLLFESENKLEARDKLLSRIEPIEKYYTRVRQIAIEENNKAAVVALSKYQKQQDKPLIEQLLKDPNGQTHGFAAVVNFPDASFFPVLDHALRNEVTKNNTGTNKRLQLLYQAIVQYKDHSSRKLIQSILNEAKGMQSIYHSDYLHQALRMYPATIYNELLKPINSITPTEKGGH